MAVKYGFFDSVNGDRKYSADDISNYFLKLISNGVFSDPTNNLQVTAGSGMSVDVAAGWGFINCKWANNIGVENFSIDAADSILDRIDRVVLRLRPGVASRDIVLDVKKGTAAATPSAPSLTRVSGGVWELSLAQIYVAAGATSITAGSITDERADETVCGYVSALVPQSSGDGAIYYCNGVNDNVMLAQYVTNWIAGGKTGAITISGTFGVDATTTEGEGGVAYSLLINNSSGQNITLNFERVGAIEARGTSFGSFAGCDIKGLKVHYNVTPSGAITALSGVNSNFVSCKVYGEIAGTAVRFIAYSGNKCRYVRCDSDIENLGMVYGLVCTSSTAEGCVIKVKSTGTDYNAHGAVIADTSSCRVCTFEAITAATNTSAWGVGAQGAGIYTDCVFIGMGAVKGQGFYISAAGWMVASGCIFRGYTKDTINGFGLGLGSGANASTLLTGINCNQVSETGYSQTGSMEMWLASGTYSGSFYKAERVPATMVSLGSFTANRA